MAEKACDEDFNLSYDVLRKAQKSTKSTDGDTHKDSLKPDGYIFVPDESRIQDGTINDKENITPLHPVDLPLRKQCQKYKGLIGRAIDKEDYTDSISREQYFSQNANLNDTRREISDSEKVDLNAKESKLDKLSTDDRIHFGVFQNRELCEEDEADNLVNESILTTTGKKSPTDAGATEDIKSTEPVEDLGRIELNILLTSDNLNSELTEGLETEVDALPFKTPVAKVNVDRSVRNTERKDDIPQISFNLATSHASPISKKVDDVGFNPQQLDIYSTMVKSNERQVNFKKHMESLYFDKSKLKQDINQKVDINDSLLPEPASEEKVEKLGSFNWNVHHYGDSKILQATTAKEAEEELTQKIELIDETPLVEAHKPKIEGFNQIPKILGDTEPNINCFSEKGSNSAQTGTSSRDKVPANFDDIAKRCLDTKTGNIDEILLQEMEKMGCPITINRDSHSHSPVIDGDLVQMDVLKKQKRRTIDKEDLDLESHEYERGAVELCSIEKKYPTRCMRKENILPEPTADSDNLKDLEYIQVQKDSCDKNKISYNTGEYDQFEKYDPSEKFSCYTLKAEQELWKQSQTDNIWGAEPLNPIPLVENNVKDTTAKVINGSVSCNKTITNNVSDMWDEQLDPNHVLTCNETCPISPKPQLPGCETARLEGTEDIFDESFKLLVSKSLDVNKQADLRSTLDAIKLNEKNSSNQDTTETLFEDSMTQGTPRNLIEDLGANKSVISSDTASISQKFSITLPNLNEDVSLTELLKRVRDRSRILGCKNELKELGVELETTMVGKCPRKAPSCLPCAPRSPPMEPLPPPPMGLPKLKRAPTPCKRRKKPGAKCSRCELDVSPGLQFGPKSIAQEPVAYPEMVCGLHDATTQIDIKSSSSMADLTNVVIKRLQNLGKVLGEMINKGKADVFDATCLVTYQPGSNVIFARDYEPWTPIPSWPHPKKEEPRPKAECSPGCKSNSPTPLDSDQAPGGHGHKPCEGFPRRRFSY